MLTELIANSLGLSPAYISRLASTASHRYKYFTIAKSNGGFRNVYHPAKQLKAVQCWLLANILESLPVHDAAAAYRSGRNIADHAQRHLKGHYLLRMDFTKFFESISAVDITNFLNDSLTMLPAGWSSDDTLVFVRFVCMDGHLTIGAVTSPAMSNTICNLLDRMLTKECVGQGITYTRYADDMFFSTKERNVLVDVPQMVEATLKGLKYPASLQINASKTRHSSLKRRRRVTGIVLSSQGRLSIGRALKRRTRSQIHKLNSLGPTDRAKLAGWLAFIRDVEPSFFNRLVLKYGQTVALAARSPKTP